MTTTGENEAGVGQPSVRRSAAILSLGNVLSRGLGMVREIVIPHFYGASGLVSAFAVAEFTVRTLYDLLVGGMLTAALVPVLSDYARPGRRREFADVAGTFFTVLTGLAAVVVLALELLAPQVVGLIGGGLSAEHQAEAVTLMRLMAPALWLFAASGVLAGILFAQRRFTLVALGDALYNLGIVIAVPLLYRHLDIRALAVGVLLGSLIQLGLRLPDLRGLGLRLRRPWRHPALRRMLVLYMPILFSIVVGMVQGGIDRRLASGTGPNSLAYMRTATTLYQLPHGLVAVAVALAALPTLSQWAAEGNWSAYRRTLAAGLRAVLVLCVPATIGLWVLAEPVIRLLAEHGAFTATDTAWAAAALRFYLFGLVFACVDWPLNFAFYARGDSLTPALVGVASVFVYLAVALALLGSLGFLGLALADGTKHAAHALIMLTLFYRRQGPLGEGVARTAGLTLLAGLVMGAAVYGLTALLLAQLGTAGLGPRLTVVVLPAVLGGLLYVALLNRLRLPEAALVVQLARRFIPSP